MNIFEFIFKIINARDVKPRAIIDETGKVLLESLPIIIIFSIAIGLSISMQFIVALKTVGAEDFSSMFFTIAILKEIGPMISGAQVLIRSGSRILSEIASMKDRGILTQMEVIPIHTIGFVVVPRFVALAISPTLFIPITLLLAFSSAYLFILNYGVSEGAFFDGVIKGGNLYDILVGCIKTLIIGTTNALISTYYGFSSPEGPEGLSKSMTKAMSISMISSILINYILTIIFY